jgi:hypothetical protein
VPLELSTLKRPELHLAVFRLQKLVVLLDLDLSAVQRSVLHLDVSAKTGTLAVSGQQESVLVNTYLHYLFSL